jgi:hypothetical protein
MPGKRPKSNSKSQLSTADAILTYWPMQSLQKTLSEFRFPKTYRKKTTKYGFLSIFFEKAISRWFSQLFDDDEKLIAKTE